MAKQVDDDLFICSLSLAEIYRGILEKPSGKKRRQHEEWFKGPEGPPALFRGRKLAFDEDTALIWAVCPVLGLGHVGEQLNESHRRLLQSATLSLPILDRERIPHPCNSFHAIGAAGQTTARGRPDRACGNSVLPTRHLVESPDQIPGPSDDSRGRPHP
jgi:hypothetical protein